MSQVIRVSHHCAVYRGFTIITLPRKKQASITRYHVWHLGSRSASLMLWLKRQNISMGCGG